MRRLTIAWFAALGLAAACSDDYQLVTPGEGASDAGADASPTMTTTTTTTTTTTDDAAPSSALDAAPDAPLVDADATVALDAGPCDLSAPFGEPVPVDGLQHNSFDRAAITVDELTAYLEFNESATVAAVWYATRASPTAAFNAPQALLPSTPGISYYGPTVTPDGGTLFYSQGIAMDGGDETATFYSMTKDGSGAWLAPKVVEVVALLGASVSANGHMYSSRYADDTMSYDIELQTVAGATPIALPELSSPVYDCYPAISQDELTIYFASTRATGGQTFDSNDIYVATRTSPTGTFSTPQLVSELSTPDYFEGPDMLSADGCRLYMSSNKTGVVREYMATKPPAQH